MIHTALHFYFEKLGLKLPPLAVIVGQNGVGKTAFLETCNRICTFDPIYEKYTLLSYDDLGATLHPIRQAETIKQFRKLQKEFFNMIIIGVTYSPHLVDLLDGDEVFVMHHQQGDISNYLKPLSAHPDYARMKGTLSTGEFWSSVGEEWVIPEHKRIKTP